MSGHQTNSKPRCNASTNGSGTAICSTRAKGSRVASYFPNFEADKLPCIERRSKGVNFRFESAFNANKHAKCVEAQASVKAKEMTLLFQREAIEPHLFQSKKVSLEASEETGGSAVNSTLLSNDSINGFIQSSWSYFSQLVERDRLHVLKGMLQQCTVSQLNSVQTAIAQLQLERGHNAKPRLHSSSNKPKTLSAHQRLNLSSKYSPSDDEADAGKPDKTLAALYSSEESNGVQSDLYMRLFNESFDVSKAFIHTKHLGLKELQSVFRGLALHTHKQQKVLDLIRWVGSYANQLALQQLQDSDSSRDGAPAKVKDRGSFSAVIVSKIVACAKDVTSAVESTLYIVDPSDYSLLATESTWLKPAGRVVKRDQLLCQETLMKGQPVSLYSVKTSEEYTKEVEEFYQLNGKVLPECVLSIPVLHPERSKTVIGVIELVNKAAGPPYFSADDHEFAVLISRTLTTLLFPIDLASLTKYLRRSFNQRQQNDASRVQPASGANETTQPLDESHQAGFQTLWTASQMVSKDLDMKTLVQALKDQSRELVQAERATVFVVDHESRQLLSTHSDNAEEVIRFSMNKGIAGHVACTGEVLNVPDAYLDERFNQDVDKKTGYRTRAILCAPIINGAQQVVAVMEMLNKLPEGGVFSKADEDIVMTFSSCAGAAIDRSIKFEQLQQKLKTYQSENATLRSIQSSLPISVVGLDAQGRLSYINQENLEQDTAAQLSSWRSSRYNSWLLKSTESQLGESFEASFARQKFFKQIQAALDDSSQAPVTVNYALLNFAFSHTDGGSWDNHAKTWERRVHYHIRRLPTAQNLPGESKADAAQCVVIVVIAEVTPHSDLRMALSRALPDTQVSAMVPLKKPAGMLLQVCERSACVIHIAGCQQKRDVTTGAPGVETCPVEVLHSFALLVQSAVKECALQTPFPNRGGVVDSAFGGRLAATVVYGLGCETELSTLSNQHQRGDYAEHAFDAITLAFAAQSLEGPAKLNLTFGLSFGSIISGLFGGAHLGGKLSGVGKPFQQAEALARLASLYGVRVVVDDQVYSLTKERFVFRELDRISFECTQPPAPVDALLRYPGFLTETGSSTGRVVGRPGFSWSQSKAPPTTLYEIVGVVGQELPQEVMTSLICFELGRNEYRAGNFELALAQFQKAGLLMSDPPSKLYCLRCEAMLDHFAQLSDKGTKVTPQPWDGTWVYPLQLV